MARFVPLLLGAALVGSAQAEYFGRRECGETDGDFYQFSAKRINDSQLVNFEEYKGKVILVANVATF